VRLGYQVTVDVVTHRQNMAENRPPDPVLMLTEVLADGSAGTEGHGWQRKVHQVRFLGPSRTEYGWGPERAQCRGRRFGAAIWVFTEHAIEYLDETGVWRQAP
jgi:hypothetical protein